MTSDSDYEARFGGVGRLFGKQGLERLRAAHVCVIGVGGVGAWTVEALARSGVGALTLVDADDVCVTNTNRQLPALDGNIGRPKVAVLAERVRLIAPECRVVEVMEFYTRSNAAELLAPVLPGRSHALATMRGSATNASSGWCDPRPGLPGL